MALGSVAKTFAVPLALVTLSGFGALLAPSPASAIVYCTAPGIPAGCVVRRPVRPVVYCTAPGVPVGCVGRPGVGAPGVGVRPGLGAGAPGVGIKPGVGLNARGPVNRIGVR